MGIIQVDPASLAIGYVAGTLLCWYLQEMLYGESKDDRQTEDYRERMYTSLYSRHNDVSICTPEPNDR